MALSTDEKKLLQMGISDGSLANYINSGLAQPQPQVAITPEVLAKPGIEGDLWTRTFLNAYKTTKAALIQQAVTRAQARISAVSAELAFVQGVVIG